MQDNPVPIPQYHYAKSIDFEEIAPEDAKKFPFTVYTINDEGVHSYWSFNKKKNALGFKELLEFHKQEIADYLATH